MRSLFVILIFFLFIMSARASQVQLSQVRFTLEPQQSKASLVLENLGEQSTTWQITVKKWSQSGGEPVYQKTDDWLAVPIIFTVPGKKTQLIRLARMTSAQSVNVEQTYRLFIQQIAEKSTKNNKNNQLKVLFKLSLPIFIEPEKVDKAYQFTIKKLSATKAQLSFNNLGNVHQLLLGYVIQDKDGAICQKNSNIFVYVLAQNKWQKTIQLNSSCASHNVLSIKPKLQV